MDKAKPVVRIGEEFKAAPAYQSYYYINLIVVLAFFFFSWFIPLLILAPEDIVIIVSLFIGIPVLIVTSLALYWIPRYYDTLLYKLTGNEMVWRRGVWFKKTGIVPYNRITNIDIEQGPISRKLGIGPLKIQTAGYSGTSGGAGHSAEIRIEGVVHFEELRKFIMGFVHGKKPVGTVGTFESDGTALGELVKIRKLLEKGKR